jgi:hypothetical protein
MNNRFFYLSLATAAAITGFTPALILPTYAQTSPVLVEITRKIECGRGFAVETRSYVVSICPSANGSFYVGEAKDGSESLTLNVTSTSNQVYTARNGGFTYTLNMNDKLLIITTPNGESYSEGIIRVINS